MIRILVADDHEVVRRGLILVLRQEPGFEVVGEARDGQEALRRAAETAPDVALLDWKMPQMDGLEAARRLKEQQPAIRCLVLTGAPADAAALDALEQGVDGFVHKDISPAALAHAVRQVAAGRRYLGNLIAEALLARSRRPAPEAAPPVPLSEREQQILALMATVATYKEMAVQLGLSETTIHTYARRVFSKLGQPNRTQAVLAALRLGLIELE